MASLNNYIKGNLLLQKGFHNASLEAYKDSLKFCQKLSSFSLQENMNTKDRVVLIINFDIGKHKRFLYENLAGNDVRYENKKIVQLQSKLFVIEYNFDFGEADSQENSKKALYDLVTEFKTEVLRAHPQPLFMFVQGLEIAELYLDPYEIYYWLLKLLEEFNVLKQAYFLIQSDIISTKLLRYLETVINCRVLVEGHAVGDDKIEGNVQMVLAKNSGFSYFEGYKVVLKGEQKITCKIDKVTKQMIEAQKNEEQDLQKFFQSSFKIELSDRDKKSREGLELPHMKAMNPENVWKDYLKEVQEGEEEIDPEQDEDEDLDV